MKIGDEVYIHGYIDEIRNDVVIIHNNGGYFGTVPSEIMVSRKDESTICDFCRYYNSNIPCGSTPSACEKADKFAKEFINGLSKCKESK